MATKVLVVHYSRHGHVEALANAVASGVEMVRNAEVRVRRVPELADAPPSESSVDEVMHDDFLWADAVAWGTPTRYGMMATPMKCLLDGMVKLWLRGDLEDKPTGVFTSSASMHGGQESTILTTLVPLLHFGMIFVGTPYVQNPQILTTDAVGGSPLRSLDDRRC